MPGGKLIVLLPTLTFWASAISLRNSASDMTGPSAIGESKAINASTSAALVGTGHKKEASLTSRCRLSAAQAKGFESNATSIATTSAATVRPWASRRRDIEACSFMKDLLSETFLARPLLLARHVVRTSFGTCLAALIWHKSRDVCR